MGVAQQICEFCGYRFPAELGRYGCPNCQGEGLGQQRVLCSPSRNLFVFHLPRIPRSEGQHDLAQLVEESLRVPLGIVGGAQDDSAVVDMVEVVRKLVGQHPWHCLRSHADGLVNGEVCAAPLLATREFDTWLPDAEVLGQHFNERAGVIWSKRLVPFHAATSFTSEAGSR